MIKIKEYVKVQSLEEAWQLNQKKSSVILGGMLWLKMGTSVMSGISYFIQRPPSCSVIENENKYMQKSTDIIE